MELKEDDVVLCRVKKIEGTAVFLEIEGCAVEGHMILSEVAAGRIRNLRQYVSPGRLVVCKVLKVNAGSVELSLRRVTAKERDNALDLYKKERAFRNVLKFAGENAEEVINKIKEDSSLDEFFSEVRENIKVVEKYVRKENIKRVVEFFSEKSTGDKRVECKIKLRSDSPEGIEDIKYILDIEAEIHYLGGSRFSVSVSGKDFKDANMNMQKVIETIEKRAKEKKAVFELEKEK